MKNTAIEWADHSFNPWLGCTMVSPGCAHCYAAHMLDHRLHRVQWNSGRVIRTSNDYWRQPRKWDREALAAGRSARVFCASLADVFDDAAPDGWRWDLISLIAQTPHLTWMLLTKRPERAVTWWKLWRGNGWGDELARMWIGVSVEDQIRAEERIAPLRSIRAAVRFLSCEPLLEPLHLDLTEIHWVICGGESGPKARPMGFRWVMDLQRQAEDFGVPFFFKQWGGVNKAAGGRLLNGRTYSQVPDVRLFAREGMLL